MTGMKFKVLAQVGLSLIALISSIGFCHESLIFASEPPQETQVKIISNPKHPAPPDGKKKRIIFEEELTIGAVEGDENYMFGDYIVFNTDDEGDFYITDWDRKRIQKYSPDGEFLLTIGKRGQGPGEFGNLSIARFDSRQRLYVTDIANHRINFFDKAGNFLEQITIPDVFENLYINSKGQYISSRSRFAESEYGFSAFLLEWGIYDSQFKLISEFYSEKRDLKPPEGQDTSSRAKFAAGILSELAFQPYPYYVVTDNDLVYFGTRQNYIVEVFSPVGEKVRSIRRDYDPIRVSDKDKEHFIINVAENLIRIYPEEVRKEAHKFIKYPKYKPAYSSFCMMENGWLVVVVDSLPGEGSLIDLFDQEGVYVGHFKTDIPSENLFFKNGRAYAVDEKDGYKFAKRYRFRIVEEEKR
ncbi:MAG: 6-bladed beta-propeller [Candidatus Aminicenantales bacterium]